jgi:hypothetical protein
MSARRRRLRTQGIDHDQLFGAGLLECYSVVSATDFSEHTAALPVLPDLFYIRISGY